MSILIDYQYVSMVMARLKYPSNKGNGKWQACCPLCGETNPRKRKFYIVTYPNGVFYNCFVCQESGRFSSFLKKNYPELYSNYQYDLFVEQGDDLKKQRKLAATIVKPASNIDDYKTVKPEHEKAGGILSKLKRISQLPDGHFARKYILNRKLPTHTHAKFYFAPHFSNWINTLVPQKFQKPPKTDPRIVIPLIDKKGDVFGVQGRALMKDQEPRYLTVKFDPDMPKIYGLNSVDPAKPVQIVEGPIDSEFLPNAVAMTGADLSIEQALAYIGSEARITTWVMDNQPRNKDVCKQIQKLLEAGQNVCIWPPHIKSKDINQLVLDGHDPVKLIEQSTFSGLMGQLALSKWRKD